MQTTADFTIIGGGIIGVNIAIELKARYSDCRILLLEKEESFGQHASGRNSGVIHAGFYYTADSMKAKFTQTGNALLKAYCERKGLPINRCGKLVVAKNEAELDSLAELKRRGDRNGVELHELTAKEAEEIEPRVKTFEKALFSPNTATASPADVMRSLIEDAHELGIVTETGTRYIGRKGSVVQTNHGDISAGYVVNAAGLYADRIAKDYGFSQSYMILPFKGLYLYSSEPPGAFRTNIYPVPNLANPFLGVHFTVTVEGKAKIGPTAIPCLWREQYGGLENFDGREFIEIAWRSAGMMLSSNFDFRGLALEEMKKYYRPNMVAQAALLAKGVHERDYTHWTKPGIRAQLYDVVQRKLVMDFCLEGDADSFHVLNAVSPAWTCSIPFSRYICDQIEAQIGGRARTLASAAI